MHQCPACSYRLDALPGVPRVQFGEFNHDVACPECGFVIRKGQRVVVGSTVAAAVGARLRWSQLAGALVGILFALNWSIQGLYAKAKVFGATGDWSFSWRDPVQFLFIVGFAFIARSLYRMLFSAKYEPKAGVESNAAWIIEPGALRVLRAAKIGEAAEQVAVLSASEIRTIRAVELPRVASATRLPIQLAVYRDSEKDTPHVIHVSAQLIADELATSLLASVRREMRAEELRAREAAPILAGQPIVVRGVPFEPMDVGEVPSPLRGWKGTAVRFAGPALGMVFFFGVMTGLGARAGGQLLPMMIALGGFLLTFWMVAHLRSVAREKRSSRATWTCSRDGLVIETNLRRYLFKRRETKRFSPQAVRSIDVRMKHGAAYLEVSSVHEREPVAVLHPDDWSGSAPDTLAQAMREALGESSPANALAGRASQVQ